MLDLLYSRRSLAQFIHPCFERLDVLPRLVFQRVSSRLWFLFLRCLKKFLDRVLEVR